MPHWIEHLLTLLALPQFSLTTVFIVSFFSATFIPLGSEPLVIGLVKLNPQLFWPVILMAALGNTLGGAVVWWMGFGARRVANRSTSKSTLGSSSENTSLRSAAHARASVWLEKLGAKACLLAWLPVVGDPLCAVAGWLKLPFWPCVAYMAIGKFARYLVLVVCVLNAIAMF